MPWARPAVSRVAASAIQWHSIYNNASLNSGEREKRTLTLFVCSECWAPVARGRCEALLLAVDCIVAVYISLIYKASCLGARGSPAGFGQHVSNGLLANNMESKSGDKGAHAAAVSKQIVSLEIEVDTATLCG